jgi:hypothetical protein
MDGSARLGRHPRFAPEALPHDRRTPVSCPLILELVRRSGRRRLDAAQGTLRSVRGPSLGNAAVLKRGCLRELAVVRGVVAVLAAMESVGGCSGSAESR